MAIRRIKINDFQSHKDTEIKLDEGVTIISGSSDIGKSCLMGIERERPMSEKWKANLQTMARLSLERPLFKGYIMDRFWGKEKDAIAAKQLGVEEDWSIFMMANEMDYIDDIRRVILNSEEEDDYMFSGSAEQIIEAVHAATRRVMLPGRLQLVGMSPLGDETKEVYGVVDFSEISDE